jgi:hypothetical protein
MLLQVNAGGKASATAEMCSMGQVSHDLWGLREAETHHVVCTCIYCFLRYWEAYWNVLSRNIIRQPLLEQ